MRADSATRRLAEVEGLRAVAATSILVFHCWLFSSPATLRWNLGPVTAFVQPLQSGVTLFFVLSGFLLYRPIVRAVLEGRDPPSARSYLRNRALRILPAYWVILTIALLALGSVTDPRTVAADFSLTQTYDPRSIFTGLLPAWSLTIEVAFYLSLPLLALVARSAARALGRNVVGVVTPVVGLLVFGALGKALVAAYSPGPERAVAADWHTVLDRSFLTHADLFAFGMAAAVCLALGERQRMPLILGYYFLPPYLYDAAVAFFAALLLVKVLGTPRPGGRSLLVHPWTLAWGRVSYSVFLWNYPVLLFLAAHGVLASGNDAPAFLFNLAIATTVVGSLSFLTYRYVEAPALALKHRRSAHVAHPAPAPSTTS
jgi:peptidoglycan/LPS O-acetylase OafA/YrhL